MTKIVVASVSVTIPKATLIVGESVQAAATQYDASGNVLTGRSVSWTSSSSGIATVSSEGLIASVGQGTATITATSEGKAGSVSVVVIVPSPEPVSSLTLNLGAGTLAKGQSQALVATPKDANGKVLVGKNISWTTSDPTVASVTSGGVVTSLSAGSAQITAISEGKTAAMSLVVIAFTAIQPGTQNICAIAIGGQLYCAGAEYGGQATPVGVGLKFASLALGGEPPASSRTRICGITTDGDGYCWGSNAGGELGVGDSLVRLVPTLVSGGLRFKQITAGRYHTCALTLGGAAYCWGEGSRGQLGNASEAGSPVPAPVGGGLTYASIVAGKDHTCAVTSGGTAYCWGSNNLAELGDGTTVDHRTSPFPVAGGIQFGTITSRTNTSCGLDFSGKAWCWGDNTILQLGASPHDTCDFGKPCTRSPLAVSTSLSFATIAGSQYAMCATTTDLKTYCWGGNMQEMFGSATPPLTCGVGGFGYGCTLQPTAGPAGFAAIAGSNRNYCGIRNDGIAYCWGGNDLGQLGSPGVTMTSVPVVFGVNPAPSS